jgi:hypothetical protein
LRAAPVRPAMRAILQAILDVPNADAPPVGQGVSPA